MTDKQLNDVQQQLIRMQKQLQLNKADLEHNYQAPSRWKNQNYFSTLSAHIRNSDSPNKSRRKLVPRRFSQDNEMSQDYPSEKRAALHVFGSSGSSKYSDENKFNSISNFKQEQKTAIEPFRIKDYIPQINSQIKSELSKQYKNNFLQFLIVQKAGQSGDQKFFDGLIHKYNVDPYQIKQVREDKSNIQYLSKRDEREETIDQQVQVFYRSLHKRSKVSSEVPLDRLIIEKNQYMIQRLPKFRAKLDAIKKQKQ